VFWTDSPNQYGTVGALAVKDKDDADMVEENPASTTLTFTYNYDATQNGHGTGANENITNVGIGKTYAQFVKATGTITKINLNPFSLVAALERNYST